jgi:hypothetical protein
MSIYRNYSLHSDLKGLRIYTIGFELVVKPQLNIHHLSDENTPYILQGHQYGDTIKET